MFKKNLLLYAAVTLFLVVTSYFYLNNSLSFHFVDEEHNLVLGSFLLKGEKMYQDMFNNHQPLAHIISAFIQYITHPNSIYSLIKTHREFMIIWTFAWSIFLLKRFTTKVVLFIFLYELAKIVLLGNLFLSESLIIYPLVYLIALLLDGIKTRKEYFLIGFWLSFIALTFAPVWPVLLFILGWLAIKVIKKDYKLYLYLLIGFLPLVIIVLRFITVSDYFFDTVYINSKYYIPYGIEMGSDNVSMLSFLTPVLSFFSPILSPLRIFVNILSAFLIFSLTLLIKQKKYALVISLIILLGLANIRYVQPGQDYYRGFHLLPWFAILIFICSYFGAYFYHHLVKLNKNILLILIGLSLVLAFVVSKPTLFAKRDIQQDLYINYSRQFDNGVIVNIMKQNKETLFVSPDEWLVYWQADINHPRKMINYYDWMSRSPELRSKIDDIFNYQRPTYLYCNCPQSSYLTKYFSAYTKIKKFNDNIPLFVLSDKLKKLTPAQKDKLKFYGVIL